MKSRSEKARFSIPNSLFYIRLTKISKFDEQLVIMMLVDLDKSQILPRKQKNYTANVLLVDSTDCVSVTNPTVV